MKKCATVILTYPAAITAEPSDIVAPSQEQLMPEKPKDNPLGDYVRRVMQEIGFDFVQVSKMASRRGASIGRVTIQQIVQGTTTNPGIYTVKALALGLGRPVEEVIAAALGTPIVETQSFKASDFANLGDLYRQLPLPEQRAFKRYHLQMLEREFRRMLMQLADADQSHSEK